MYSSNGYLTQEQVSERFQISRSTLFKLRKIGLPHVRIGRMIRFEPSAVQKWIEDEARKNYETSCITEQPWTEIRRATIKGA